MRTIVFVVILGFALRMVGLSSYPAGFSADEVNQGYTAYSILKTAHDEWGEFMPIAPRSYGDYRAPLYTYLTVPSVLFFGLNEFAVRFPSAVAGTLAIVVVYLLALELAKKLKEGKSLALWSAFFLAISPWHISLSRGAFEPNLPVLLIPAGVLFFIKALENKKYMLLAALFFSLSLFAYYSSKFLVPVVLVLLFLCFIKEKGIKFIENYKLAILIMAVFSAVAFYTMFAGSSTRVADVSIVGETSWHAVSEIRYNAVLLGLPDVLARVFNNKFTYVLELFTRNYLDYFSTRFLFTQGAGEATYGMMPGMGLLYLIEFLFLLVAAVYVIFKKLIKFPLVIFILGMLLVAPIPAALTTGPGMAANRAAMMMPWIQIFSSLGAYVLFKQFSNKYLRVAAGIYLIAAITFFLQVYYFRAPIENARSMSYGWREAAKYIKSAEPFFDRIVVSKSFSEPQMFVAFYLALDPNVVQAESKDWLRYEDEGRKFVDQLGQYRLGKFIFKGIELSDIEAVNTLVMGMPKDLPGIVPDYVVYYPDGKEAIYFVSSQEIYARGL